MNEQPSPYPDAQSIWKEYGLHPPGKYIFTTVRKEPTLLVPDSVKYYIDPLSKATFIKMEYKEAKATV